MTLQFEIADFHTDNIPKLTDWLINKNKMNFIIIL